MTASGFPFDVSRGPGMVMGGASVQIAGGPIGTLGCLVRWRGVSCILGSGHVLSSRGLAEPGAAVFTPVAGDTGAIRVGAAYDNAYVEKSTTVLNRLDAALARTEPNTVSPQIGAFGTPSGFRQQVSSGDPIHLHGATSGSRQGEVRNPNWTGVVTYPDGSEARFTGLVECTPYGFPGDSGAAILDAEGRVAGVHMAGEATFSVFCPISEVLRRWPGLEIQTTAS